MLDFKIEPIIEDNKFFILSYKKNGKAVKELSTLNEKALINVNPENVKEWKEKYGFENIDPYYVGPFHYLIENISELCIKKNSGKFWKKETSDVQAIAFYTLFPLKIINLSAEINISFDVFVPVLYKPVNKEIKIDALKVYDLAIMEGRVKEIGEDDKILIKEAKEIFDKEIKNIKGKIEADIKKIKIEVEELILQKQREELEKKIKEILERLEKLRREIHRKQSSGLRYDEEMKEAKKLKEKLDNFLKAPKAVPESSLNIEFGEPKIIGGCIYHP
jgi:hypothetical protein